MNTGDQLCALIRDLETCKQAYSDLLVNSARELTAAKVKLRIVRGCLNAMNMYEDSELRAEIKAMIDYLDAEPSVPPPPPAPPEKRRIGPW